MCVCVRRISAPMRPCAYAVGIVPWRIILPAECDDNHTHTHTLAFKKRVAAVFIIIAICMCSPLAYKSCCCTWIKAHVLHALNYNNSERALLHIQMMRPCVTIIYKFIFIHHASASSQANIFPLLYMQYFWHFYLDLCSPSWFWLGSIQYLFGTWKESNFNINSASLKEIWLNQRESIIIHGEK